MAKKHMKRCSISLSIREMHIKIMRQQCTPTITVTRKPENIKYFQGYGEIKTLIAGKNVEWPSH